MERIILDTALFPSLSLTQTLHSSLYLSLFWQTSQDHKNPWTSLLIMVQGWQPALSPVLTWHPFVGQVLMGWHMHTFLLSLEMLPVVHLQIDPCSWHIMSRSFIWSNQISCPYVLHLGRLALTSQRWYVMSALPFLLLSSSSLRPTQRPWNSLRQTPWYLQNPFSQSHKCPFTKHLSLFLPSSHHPQTPVVL